MTARPTGRLAHRDDGLYVMMDRLFTAPPMEIWASLTRPAELSKWIGTYTGSPATGAVKFRSLAHDDESDWEYVSIMECKEPRRFKADFGTGDEARRTLFHLAEGERMTTLTVGQRLRSAAEAATIGPTWDFYLDRLVAVRLGRPLPTWDQYFPAFTRYYAELVVPSRPVTATQSAQTERA